MQWKSKAPEEWMLHTAWKEILVAIEDGLGPTARLHYVEGKSVMPDLLSLETFCGLGNSERKLAPKCLQTPEHCNFTAEHSTITLMPPSHRVAGRLAANIWLFMWSLEDMSGNYSGLHGATMKRKPSMEKIVLPEYLTTRKGIWNHFWKPLLCIMGNINNWSNVSCITGAGRERWILSMYMNYTECTESMGWLKICWSFWSFKSFQEV